jgi:hypothetical protein
LLCKNKEMEATLIVGEAAAGLILAGAAYMMSLKEK